MSQKKSSGDPPRDPAARRESAPSVADRPRGRGKTDEATRAARRIQREVDRSDEERATEQQGGDKKSGAVQAGARPQDLSLEHFDRTMRTNLYGYFHMAKAALPHLKQGSAIINTGSVTGLLGSKDLIDYSMTKGGIHAFTRSLSENLVEKGIRVNAVAPGPVWTPLNPADKEAKKVAKFGADTPMKRPAQPEELSPAYVFLASPVCSSYITGEILPVIGGYSGG